MFYWSRSSLKSEYGSGSETGSIKQIQNPDFTKLCPTFGYFILKSIEIYLCYFLYKITQFFIKTSYIVELNYYCLINLLIKFIVLTRILYFLFRYRSWIKWFCQMMTNESHKTKYSTTFYMAALPNSVTRIPGNLMLGNSTFTHFNIINVIPAWWIQYSSDPRGIIAHVNVVSVS